MRVDFPGQWRELSDGHSLQNGGPDYHGCATERIARVDANNKVVWELRPTDASDDRLTPKSVVSGLVAAPDGSTLAGLNDGSESKHSHSTVMRLDSQGKVVAQFTDVRAPEFSRAYPYVGDNGEVFVMYDVTNFGYAHGRFQLPGGRVWKLRPNQAKRITARVDLKRGTTLWEHEGDLISARHGEVLLSRAQFRGRRSVKSRYRFERLSYAGHVLSSGTTRWFSSEAASSLIRHNDELWMTTTVEILDHHKRRVRARNSRLRVFDLKGHLLHTRKLSDGAQLARPTFPPRRYVCSFPHSAPGTWPTRSAV